MRQMIAGLTALALCVGGFSAIHGKTQEFELEISLVKEVYSLAEPIWLDVTLTNIGEDTARTWGLCLPCMAEFKVILTDEQGDTMDYRGPEYAVLRQDGWVMGPGEDYYQCLNLSECFGEWPEPRALVVGYLFTKSLKPAKFAAEARYRVRGQDVVSNQVSFEVRQPAGEDEKVYRLLQEAYDLYRQGKDDVSRNKLNEIVTFHAKSVYAQSACRDLFLWEKLIEKYPDSGFTQNAILAIASRKGAAERKKFLQSVIQTGAKTRSARFAQQMLWLRY